MSTATIAAAVPPAAPDRRLAFGLMVSAVLHAAALLGIAPEIPRFVEARPLQVEIRDAAGAAGTELAAVSSAGHAAAAPAESSPAAAAVPPASMTPQDQRHAPVELAMPFDKYYSAREVDERAVQTNDVALVYPKSAYEMRVKGRVRLKILISEHGAVDDVSIVAAEPAGFFEAAALAAARALQFSPAVKDGRRVKSQKVIEVVLDPYESINIP